MSLLKKFGQVSEEKWVEMECFDFQHVIRDYYDGIQLHFQLRSLEWAGCQKWFQFYLFCLIIK